MFTPLDILYIVLAFCILWMSAGLFWLIWQIASILKNINDTVGFARDKMDNIEKAIVSMKNRFDKMGTVASVLVEGAKGLIEYGMEKRAEKKTKKEPEV
ncbi:hypothetical protein ACFLZY_00565 [Patescibacteria group bacterium]